MKDKSNIREISVNDPQKPNYFVTNNVHTTKYTPLTFIPYFLMHELSRPANIFFCLIIAIQVFNPNDPDKFSTIIPLSIVLLFTACKEIYEDLTRRTLDNEANYSMVRVVRDRKLVEIQCKMIKVGDVVRVKKGERFPADLLLISSSEPQGMAYLETSNVDGESNLKIRMSHPRTAHLVDEEAISDFQATIRCEQPNERIYSFEGNMDNGKECFSLDQTNILLRGAVLKNTSWIYGIVVYTGHQTKIMMNSNETPTKRTKMERKTDQQYFYISMGLAFLTLVGAIGSWYYNTKVLPNHWYLNVSDTPKAQTKWGAIDFIAAMLSYLMLLNTLVPISLSVTLEFIKLIMAYLVSQDLELYDPETESKAIARSSNLMEELGQVQCILTDKTGTLTRNEMILKHLIIEGETFLNCNEPDCEIRESAKSSDKIDFFLKMLAACHTVMIDYSDPENPCYQGSSPDELAMVNVASLLDYKFDKRSSGTITVDIRGQSVIIEVFAVIEFTSARKRMSIVALLPDDNYYIFSKGADSIILDRLNADSLASFEVKQSLKGLEEFASAGLRTLCFAYRKLDKDFALEWLDKWHDALNTVTDRQVKVDSVAELIEKDLQFIGATGVEDRLQDGVPETVDILTKANIKIWMLTGDRSETAISSAFLSNLIKATTIQLHLLNNDLSAISKSLDNFENLMTTSPDNSSFALVINGAVAEVILSDSFMKSKDLPKFLDIVKKCQTLLCCRLSPLQKSQITRFARDKLKFVTLAVGDGGNDVSMIQAANVGVGISGKEGLQAARSADFSIAQFKFLVKLVLVHGSWSFHRLSRVVMYSIYKNFVLFFSQFWFSYFNSFSAQSVFEPWMYINWNLVFTCWPPTIIGLTDQYVLASELVENPQLYEFGQKNKFYDNKTFWRSAVNAIFHSFLIFFTINLMFPEGFTLPSGQSSTAYMLGSILFAIILSTVCLKILLFTNYLTVVLALFVIFSAGLWYLIIPVVHRLFPTLLPNASTMELFNTYTFWALVLLVPVLVTARDFLWKFYRRQFRPHPYHIVQELKLAQPPKGEGKNVPGPANLIFEGTNRKPRRSLGFSFSQTYGQSRVLQAYGQSPKLTSSLRQTTVNPDDI